MYLRRKRGVGTGRDTLNETIDRMYAEDVVYKLFEEQDK